LSAQAIIMFNAPVQKFVLGNVAVQIVFALLPFGGKCPRAAACMLACPPSAGPALTINHDA